MDNISPKNKATLSNPKLSDKAFQKQLEIFSNAYQLDRGKDFRSLSIIYKANLN